MLWWVLACFAGALAVALLAPLLLTVGRKQLLHPRTALTAWFGAFFTGITLTLTGLIVSAIVSLSPPVQVGSVESLLLHGIAWLGLGVFGALAAYVATSAEPLVEHQRAAVHALAPVARSREARSGFTLVRFTSSDPVAFAVPGRHPEIFVSSALEELLSKPQVDAVLAHEYAHLRHRHGWALCIAQVNAVVLVRLRAGQALLRATNLLVELAADDVAARQAGAANLGNALSILATHQSDPGMMVRAERLTNKRWPRASRRRLPKAIAAPMHAVCPWVELLTSR